MRIDDRILELFKQHKGFFLSGEEISRSLEISRQALWKHIEKLRELGYIIEAVPHHGYRLRDVPSKVVLPEIKWNLKTKFIGRQIHFYETVGSTNNVAYDLAQKGEAEGSVVIAREQTKGKGRLGRSWVSPQEGGVYLSCILRPDIMPNEVPKITLVAAVSAVKAVRKFSGLKALIKWPNDILISDRKAGGILTELKAEMDRVDFVILGIGINVNISKNKLPQGATSIKEESRSSADFSTAGFIRTLLGLLEEEYVEFKEKGFAAAREELKRYSCTLGRYVSVTTIDRHKLNGKAVDINPDGALVVKKDSGEEEVVLSGDVTLVR